MPDSTSAAGPTKGAGSRPARKGAGSRPARKGAGSKPARPAFAPEEVLISRAMSQVEPAIGTVAVQRALPKYTYHPRPPDIDHLPVQSKVDRRPPYMQVPGMPLPEHLSQMFAPVDIFTNDDPPKHIQTLHYPAFGRYGQRLPSDPSAFSLTMPFGVAICPTLAPYAAARCGLR